MHKIEPYPIFFDVNVLNALHLLNKQLSRVELLCLKSQHQRDLDANALQQIVCRLNDTWLGLQFSQLRVVFRFRLNMVLFVFDKGVRFYTFDGEAELLNFLFTLQIDWIMADKRMYINQGFVASFTHVLNEEIELRLTNGLLIKCLSMQQFNALPINEAFLSGNFQHV